MKYQWLFREEIDHGLSLVEQIAAYRADYDHICPHGAVAWNRPAEIHTGPANPVLPNSDRQEILPNT